MAGRRMTVGQGTRFKAGLAELRFDGMKALAIRLRKFPNAVQDRVLKNAIRTATKPIVQTAKGLVSNRYGLLQRSIGATVRVPRRGRYAGRLIARVGPRRGFKATGGVRTRGKFKGKAKVFDPVKYAHLVEKGTRKDPARPFLRPAFDRNVNLAFEIISTSIKNGIKRELKKLGGGR